MSSKFVEDRNILFSDHYFKDDGYGHPQYGISRGPQFSKVRESSMRRKHGLRYKKEMETSPLHTNLKKVKRKLAFTEEEDEIEHSKKNDYDLDFTDKIAAFRSLLKPLKEESKLFGKKLLEKSNFTKGNENNVQIREKATSHSNSSTLNSDLDLHGLKNDRYERSVLSRLADEELARQSFINYEANSFVWMKLKQKLHSSDKDSETSESQKKEEVSSGERIKSAKSSETKKIKTSAKTVHDDSDYLSKYDHLVERGKTDSRQKCPDERKGKGKTDGLYKRTKNTKNEKEHDSSTKLSRKSNKKDINTEKDFQAKFENDLDKVPEREISDICKLICDNEKMCQNNELDLMQNDKAMLLPKKQLPFTDMCNNEGQGHSPLSKSKQSNVPFYQSPKPAYKNLHSRQEEVLKMQIDGLWNKFSQESNYEDFMTHDANINKGFLSSKDEFKQTNVENYLGTPRPDSGSKIKSSNFHHLHSERTPPKRKKSRSRSKEYEMNKRNSSKSPTRKLQHKGFNSELQEDMNLSDSSKENIPSIEIPVLDHDNVLTIEDLSSSHSERQKNDKLQSKTKHKNSKEKQADGLQLIPERDITDKKKSESKGQHKNQNGGYTDLQRGNPNGDLDIRKLNEGQLSCQGHDKRQSEEDASVSGSGKSSGSQSSTVRAVELLRRMYKADPQTREDLILKARCFRRWLKNVNQLQHRFQDNVDDDDWYILRALRQNSRGSQKDIPSSSTKPDTDLKNFISGSKNYKTDQNYEMYSEKFSAEPVSNRAYIGSGFLNEKSDKNSKSDGKDSLTGLDHTDKEINQCSEHSDDVIVKSVAAKNQNFADLDFVPREIIPEKDASGRIVGHESKMEDKHVNPHHSSSVDDIYHSTRMLTLNKENIQLQKNVETVPSSNTDILPMNGNTFKTTTAEELLVSTKASTKVLPRKMGGDLFSGTNNNKGGNLSSAPSINNLALGETAQLLDTVNYGMSLQRSEIFYRHHFLMKYFTQWKETTVTKLRYKAALDMERKHLLRKAMKGFRWSINRSRIQVDIFQSRMRSYLLYANFIKWRDSAMENRQRRLQVAFSRWQEYTDESKKIRRMRQLADKRILARALQQWKIRFSMRLKENTADFHYRKKLLCSHLDCWKIFTLQSKEKCHRNKQAIEFRSVHLQKLMFTEMVVVDKKHKLAKQHYRIVELRQVFMAWLKSAHICKVERQRDMSISREHWRMSTVKCFFIQWHEQLLTQRASKASNKKLLRNSFIIWKTRWQENLQHRLIMEAEIRRQILHASIRLWYDNVCLLKERREVAIVYIQRVLIRHILYGWNTYTKYRKELRMIQKEFVNKQNRKTQQKFWMTWKSKFTDRLDIQKAKKFWSNSCVRKAVDRWKKVCHKRSLGRRLEASEPDRQLNLQKVMFQRWIQAKQKIESEKQEADNMRRIMEHSALLRRFKTWRVATQQLLTIKPMLLRKERQIATKVFDAWQNLVKHKAHCKRSKELYHKSQLSKFFTSWRQQYKLHQIEKEVKKKTLTNQLRRCIDGWRFVIKRKHTAIKFCQKNLVKNMFVYWKDRAFSEIDKREEAKEIQEWNTSLLKCYFDLWSTNAQQQISEREEVIMLMEQQRSLNRMRVTLTSWRRHFRATLVAREYKKIHSRKLLSQLFGKWHDVTKHGVKEAVHKFAVRLGLPSPYPEEFNLSTGSDMGGIVDQLQVLTEFEDFDGEADVDSGHLSPYSSSALGTPIKRLFSPTLSRVGTDLDRSLPEIEFQPSLSNTSFLDARFAMEQAVKTERLKEIVFMVIKRTRFWPISIMFDQWKEYTVQQKELRLLSSQVTTICEQMEMKMVFTQWRNHQSNCIKAKTHWDMVTKRKIFNFLFEYKCERKWKKQLSALAKNKHALTVYRKIFPVWFDKAQDKRQRERIVHLWTNTTDEEQSLIPKEQVMVKNLHTKTLKKCFAVWYLKYQQINKLRTAYNRIILQKYVTVWSALAQNKGEQRRKSNNFLERRLKSLVFKTWCVRREQKIQVEKSHRNAWERYLSEIIKSWHRWASETRNLRALSHELMMTVNTYTVHSTFVIWRRRTLLQQQVTVLHNNKLMHRVIEAWHSVTVYKKELQRKVLDFQVKTYTKQAIRMFNVWHQRYIERLKEHEEYNKLLQKNALKMAQKWHKIAQKSRCRHLQEELSHRRLQACFNKWKHGYERNLEREDQLQRYVTRKHWQMMGKYMDLWRTTLMGNQAKRLYNLKLKATIFVEWHQCASITRERKLNCQVLIKTFQHQQIQSYFVYWHNMTVACQSIKKHYNLKLQKRVLGAWHVYVQKQRQLRTLQILMTKRVNLRILQNTWYTLRGQFDYFHSLTDLAEKVVQEKNHVLMRKALLMWRERLNRVIAGHCYQHLLALRAIRKWRRFVYRNKQERKHEEEMLNNATKHHNRVICKKVLTALMDEVRVRHQVLRHNARLANKYGLLWKLKVDMMYTAKFVEEETVLKKSWKRWRLEYVKRKTTKIVSDFNEKLLLSQVFFAWKGLYVKKPQRRVSAIPVPIQSSQNTPVTQQRDNQIQSTQIPGPLYNSRASSMTNISSSRLKERRNSLPGNKKS